MPAVGARLRMRYLADRLPIHRDDHFPCGDAAQLRARASARACVCIFAITSPVSMLPDCHRGEYAGQCVCACVRACVCVCARVRVCVCVCARDCCGGKYAGRVRR